MFERPTHPLDPCVVAKLVPFLAVETAQLEIA